MIVPTISILNIRKNLLPNSWHSGRISNVPLEIQREYNEILGNFSSRPWDFKQNIYKFGKFSDDKIVNLTDDKVFFFRQMIDDIMSLNPTGMKEKYRLTTANIIYSTLIKKITAGDIISGRVSPKVYMGLIKDSISAYYKHPIGSQVDYRHVLGRMLSHYKICKELEKNSTSLPINYDIMRWGIDNQLDLVGVLEKIANNYKQTTKSFMVPHNKLVRKVIDNVFTEEQAKLTLYDNINELMSMIIRELGNSVHTKIFNREQVEDLIDYAKMYAYRVDISYSKIGQIYKMLGKVSRLGAKLLKIKSPI